MCDVLQSLGQRVVPERVPEVVDERNRSQRVDEADRAERDQHRAVAGDAERDRNRACGHTSK